MVDGKGVSGLCNRLWNHLVQLVLTEVNLFQWVQQSRLDSSRRVHSKPITLPPRKADALGSDITKATNRLNFPLFAIIFTPSCRYQMHCHPFNLDILSSLFYPSCKKIKSNIVVCFQYPHKKYASKPLSNRSHTPITSRRNDNKCCKQKSYKLWMVCCFNVIGCVCFTGCII